MWQRRELIVVGYLVIMNLIGFVMMWIDKRRAIKKEWRIRERSMFLCGVLGGCIGIWLGMQCFRHKTKHAKFVYGIPAILILQCVVSIIVYIQVVS